MGRRSNLSAKQMAMLSGLGGIIVATGFLLVHVFHTRFAALGWLLRLLLLTPSTALGLLLLVVARQRFKQGIQSGRWDSAEIEALRIAMGSSIWRAVSWVCVILLGVVAIAGTDRIGLASALLLIVQTIASIQTAVRAPHGSGRGIAWHWRNSPRLRSEHWGEG